MSTWDELATAEAERRDRKDSDWCALHADELFRQGAAWQREQLLTDDAIDQAAMALHEVDVVAELWPTFPDGMNDMYRGRARVALTAAIGDQT